MADTVNDINLNIPARGPKGDPGPAGPAGKTPVRGTDYWTAADQQVVKDWLADLIVKKEW